jgi:hypothetical protein
VIVAGINLKIDFFLFNIVYMMNTIIHPMSVESYKQLCIETNKNKIENVVQEFIRNNNDEFTLWKKIITGHNTIIFSTKSTVNSDHSYAKIMNDNKYDKMYPADLFVYYKYINIKKECDAYIENIKKIKNNIAIQTYFSGAMYGGISGIIVSSLYCSSYSSLLFVVMPCIIGGCIINKFIKRNKLLYFYDILDKMIRSIEIIRDGIEMIIKIIMNAGEHNFQFYESITPVLYNLNEICDFAIELIKQECK